MNNSAPLSFDCGSEQVEDMMQQGMPFACVEDLIDDPRLTRDHKAALWLLAWSLRDPLLQRQDALVTVRLVSARGPGPGEAVQEKRRGIPQRGAQQP